MQKEIKKQLDNILNQPAPDKIKAQLQNLGLSEKDINNQSDYIRIGNFIFNKQEIVYIKLIKEDEKND